MLLGHPFRTDRARLLNISNSLQLYKCIRLRTIFFQLWFVVSELIRYSETKFRLYVTGLTDGCIAKVQRLQSTFFASMQVVTFFLFYPWSVESHRYFFPRKCRYSDHWVVYIRVNDFRAKVCGINRLAFEQRVYVLTNGV